MTRSKKGSIPIKRGLKKGTTKSSTPIVAAKSLPERMKGKKTDGLKPHFRDR